MTNEQLEQIKAMALAVVEAIPAQLTVNGKRELFVAGEPMDIVMLLGDIENVGEKAHELNNVIQALEGRKARKK